jgi:hypothetical protein
VEGAGSYHLQVDDDSEFGSPEVNENGVSENTFTPKGTLNKGTYYWRVRVRRYNQVYNDWTPNQTFTLSLPRPSSTP